MSSARARSMSASGQSLYQVLGLQKTCTQEDIKKAYRKFALQYHPDKNPNNPAATAKFQEVNHANSVLSDTMKRGIYDRYGSIGIYVAEQFGEENVNTYFVLTSPWCKALFLFCGAITGCYLCCCFCCFCNFCCGKCKPRPAEESMRYANLREDFSSPEVTPDREQPPGQPIVVQPGSSNASHPYGSVLGEQAGERSMLSGSGGQAVYGSESYTS